MKNILKIKKCLISVSDKTNILELADKLSQLKVQIISTGNTYKTIEKNIALVKKVDSITDFPEILDGRVKTLHPKIFGGILADVKKNQHIKDMKRHGIEKIELVVVNLYPFEQVIKQTSNVLKCIENIDIGGPSMIRAAAKNYMSTAVVVDISDYKKLIEEIKNYGGISLDLRKKLAQKAFHRTMLYDMNISKWMNKSLVKSSEDSLSLHAQKVTDLRYGENPHQKAALYSIQEKRNLFYEKISGKEISFNNLNDLKIGLKLIAEFNKPTCVIIKHAIPSSVAESKNISLAWERAFNADSLSAFGGVVVLNKIVDDKLALKLKGVFLELVAAPGFTKGAISILIKKNNLRILKIKNINKIINNEKRDIVLLPDSILVQDTDNTKINEKNLKKVTKKKATKAQIDDLLFAYKIVKYVRSNAIVVASRKTTLGIGSGNTSRVDSVQFAIYKAKRNNKESNKKNLKGAVMASDAFFPFPDSIKIASQEGVAAIIQPGGSINDDKVIKEANNKNIAMVFTGKRCFSH